MDLAILIRMPVITRMLMANGPWPDEQQSVSLSGSIVDKFKQQLRPEFPHVPLVEHTLCFYRSQDLPLYKATKKKCHNHSSVFELGLLAAHKQGRPLAEKRCCLYNDFLPVTPTDHMAERSKAPV